MNIVRKQIEGLIRMIPYSETKLQVVKQLKYQSARKKIQKEGKIDLELQQKRQSKLGIEYELIAIDQIIAK